MARAPDAESLIQQVIEADAIRRRRLTIPPHRLHPFQRLWVEPFFNALGILLGELLLLSPWPWIGRFQSTLCVWMAGHAPEFNPELKRRTEESIVLARTLLRETGHWPAILGLTTHPDTIGPDAWLRFELLRQGLVVANALIDAAPKERPRLPAQCVLAIDPFALDSVPVPVGAAYAGFIHRQYLAWDRQSSTQSWIQRRWLLRGTGTDRVGWRLIRALRRNPVLMAFGGGLPHNARLLYGAREWVARLNPPRRPFHVREAECRLMTLLSEPIDGRLPAETGQLTLERQERVLTFLMELGFSTEDAQMEKARLLAEFALAVPPRLRFFRAIARRLLDDGVPLLLLPLTDAATAPRVRVGNPIALRPGADLEQFARDLTPLLN